MKQVLFKSHVLSFGILFTGLTEASYAQPLLHDNSFAANGVLQLPVGEPTSHLNVGITMLIQPDGKIVFSGVYESDGAYHGIVLRRNSDGSADNSFDFDGIRTDEFIAGAECYFFDIALQADNKIVAAGYIQVGTTQNILVARYNTDGSLDNTFGTGGFISSNISGGDEFVNTVEVQSNGKIVLGGSTFWGGATGDNLLFVRLNANGSLDNTFNSTGLLVTDMAGDSDFILCSALQADGKMLFGGYTYVDFTNDEDFLLVRLNDDGTFDTSFGSTGIVLTPIGSSYDEIWDLALQDDGKIVAAGYATKEIGVDEHYLDFALARFNANGTLDNSFDLDGIVVTHFGTSSDVSEDLSGTLVIDSEGKIIVAGSITTGGIEDFAMIRYNTNGSIDLTFDSDGFYTEDMGSDHDAIFQMELQQDGKVIALGSIETSSGSDFILARYQIGELASISAGDDVPMFEIFPNPTNGIFGLSSVSNQPIQKIEIWNSSGQIVFEKDLMGAINSSVDLSSEQNGLYLVRVICEADVYVCRLLKQD
jgi:uncharacterized delta-60 repeat protein